MKQNVTELSIRPYARLLSMLGDQLIKNEIVALTELVKNSYDADANYCDIYFENVLDEYEVDYSSRIVISDDGFGMSYDTIANHFINPATPIKKLDQEEIKSKKGRVCQGEKGVGRFSMLKLGRRVTVYTKEEISGLIHKVEFDFQNYDDEFLQTNSRDQLFLDELRVKYSVVEKNNLPQYYSIVRKNRGTDIVIEDLKGEWGKSKISELKESLVKFSPIEVDDNKIIKNKEFIINIYKNGELDDYYDNEISKIRELIDNKALYKLKGRYDENQRVVQFSYSEAGALQKTVSMRLFKAEEALNDFEKSLYGLSYYRKEIERVFEKEKTTECGSFDFQFFIFDFDAVAYSPFRLNRSEKDIVRNHRVFLYRDEIRVQPYGASDDDWLQIDRKRASSRANEMFSNDQLIGQIKITKKDNEKLKDKTSREGIIEDGSAFEQLTAIVRVILSFVRTRLFQVYKAKEAQKRSLDDTFLIDEIGKTIYELLIATKEDKGAQKSVKNLSRAIVTQRTAYEKRLKTAESLAGVGLSVEVASHDIMLTMDRIREKLSEINADLHMPLTIESKIDDIAAKAQSVEEMFALVYLKMHDLQQVFTSSKQRVKNIKVEEIIRKIQNIYMRQYNENGIIVEYSKVGKSPVIAKTIDAVLYQVFINLFDNSLYWLKLVSGERKVHIELNGDNQTVIFSDSGYGINEEDRNYIFEAFFSGKGEEGRGLGLYIARNLLDRYGYDISLLSSERDIIEKGANFLITFVKEE